jgi:hypothetical protein
VNVLDIISSNAGTVDQLGAAVGLDRAQTSTALAALLPALTSGLQRNTQTAEGLASLVGALSSGGHSRYLENPSVLTQAAAFADGNGILGHLLGTKDTSRAVAAQAAAQTGISPDILKRLLPLAATVLMGALAKQRTTTPAAASGGGLAGMLGSMLDGDRDGSVVDDMASMLGKFLR